jgi:hypothetical protein
MNPKKLEDPASAASPTEPPDTPNSEPGDIKTTIPGSRLQFLAQRLHALGAKPLYHFLDEVERGAPLRAHLERYAALPADLIKAYHGDNFAAPFVIQGGSNE